MVLLHWVCWFSPPRGWRGDALGAMGLGSWLLIMVWGGVPASLCPLLSCFAPSPRRGHPLLTLLHSCSPLPKPCTPGHAVTPQAGRGAHREPIWGRRDPAGWLQPPWPCRSTPTPPGSPAAPRSPRLSLRSLLPPLSPRHPAQPPPLSRPPDGCPGPAALPEDRASFTATGAGARVGVRKTRGPHGGTRGAIDGLRKAAVRLRRVLLSLAPGFGVSPPP